MKNTRTLWAFVAIATLALISAAAALFGYTFIPMEAVAGLGFVPMFSGEISDQPTLSQLLQKHQDLVLGWKNKQEAKLEKIEQDLVGIATKQNRLKVGGGDGAADASGSKPETWLDTKSGKEIQVFDRHHQLSKAKSEDLNLGRYLRGVVLGGRAPDAGELDVERKALGGSSNPGGGFLVPDSLSDLFIDMLRSRMVLTQAGARTVPMSTRDLTLAKLTADPTTLWHGENGALSASDPSFGAVTLSAKTLTCIVKISLELSQDAPNLERILVNSLTNAMASAIDSAGINGVSGTGAGAAPAGLVDLSGRNTVTSIGAPTSWDFVVDGLYELMADNVDLANVGALVAHPALWKKMRKLKTGISGDNTPLEAPAEVAQLPKLWTTAAPLTGGTTATGIIADWRDLLFGVRKDITIQVLNQTYLGSNLQVAILAYARVDFAAARPASFCTLEGITVA